MKKNGMDLRYADPCNKTNCQYDDIESQHCHRHGPRTVLRSVRDIRVDAHGFDILVDSLEICIPLLAQVCEFKGKKE